MKICFFNTAKVWGGGEKWHFDHALDFAKEGHQVIVISNKNSELLKRASERNIDVKSIKVTNLSFLNPIKVLSLISYFRKQKFDVIVMNFSKDLKFAAPAAQWAKIPKIVYRRGSAIPIKNSFLNRYLFHNCLTDVLANSEATKQTILHNNKNLFPQDKIKVIYNGISLHTKSFPEAKNNPLVIGNLGRLVSQKGQELLIDIAGLLRDRAVSCKFVIGGDGILMESLKQKVEEKDLGNYVEFLGFIEDSASFMAKIDIFALTSRWEGFGYVMAEAMLAKKPIVAFDISSNPELVFNEENGYLIPFENNVAFADALESLINNELKRKSFGENGYNLVCSKFDFEKNKRMVMKFLLEKS